MNSTPSPRPDPRKLQLLVERLRTGRFTYEELAAMKDLDLSRRSLQLYVETHLPAAGFTPVRGRTTGPRPRATFALPREDAGTRGDDVTRERLVWPLGVILRDGRRVYLPALVEPADSFADRRMFALERVVAGADNCGVFSPSTRTPPPSFLLEKRPRLRDLVQPWFGLIRPDAHCVGVSVHVRFDARQAPYVRTRRWHPRQHETATSDGGVELRFGPVELREGVGWCSQWIDGITVLGDDGLREAYERSLEARLRAQKSTARR